MSDTSRLIQPTYASGETPINGDTVRVLKDGREGVMRGSPNGDKVRVHWGKARREYGGNGFSTFNASSLELVARSPYVQEAA